MNSEEVVLQGLGSSGENMAKWIVTLILATAFVALDVMGIIDYKSNK